MSGSAHAKRYRWVRRSATLDWSHPPFETRIRRARRRDWSALSRLFRSVFPAELRGGALAGRLSVGYRNFFVADSDSGLVGFSAMTVNEDPTQAWLDFLGVVEAVRGRKLGGALLAHFEATAVERGFASVGLSVRTDNLAAHRLYGSRGYVTVSTDGTRSTMRKELAAPEAGVGVGRLSIAPLPVRLIDRLLYRIWGCSRD